MKLLIIIALVVSVGLCSSTEPEIHSGYCPSLPHPIVRCEQLWPRQRICRAEYNLSCTLVNCWCDPGCTQDACRP